MPLLTVLQSVIKTGRAGSLGVALSSDVMENRRADSVSQVYKHARRGRWTKRNMQAHPYI